MPTIDNVFYAEQRAPQSLQPPVVLVHGAGANHLSWPSELRRLPGRRIIALDLPGHGRSPGPGHSLVSAYAADVRDFLGALQIDHAVLIGHSMGGAIALTLGLDTPEVIAGLVLIGTGATLPVNSKILDTVLDDPGTVADMITRWAWSRDADEQLRRLGRQQLLETAPQVIHGDFLACNTYSVADRLSEIQAPALVIGGTADKMTPLKFSQELAANIPRATLVTIEGSGHYVPLEQPVPVADHVERWLDDLASE